MLPIITQDIQEEVTEKILEDIKKWRHNMVHYIKDENPELNSAIINIAQKTDLEPNALATGAYMAYLLLEKSPENFIQNEDEIEEE